jgi:hypothetical protein
MPAGKGYSIKFLDVAKKCHTNKAKQQYHSPAQKYLPLL